MEDIYEKAYKEVVEILKYVPQESVNKIPQEMREMFELNQSKTYKFEINPENPFEAQELLEETKAIFANIFRDYWATPSQKEKILAKELYEINKIEEEKRAKYNPNDIFKKKKIEKYTENLIKNNNSLPIEIKKITFFKKIINFFMKFFHIN